MLAPGRKVFPTPTEALYLLPLSKVPSCQITCFPFSLRVGSSLKLHPSKG